MNKTTRDGIPEGLFCFGCKYFKINKIEKWKIKITEGIRSVSRETECLKFKGYKKGITDENFNLIVKRIRKSEICKNELKKLGVE